MMYGEGLNFKGGIVDDDRLCNRNPWFSPEIFEIIKRQLLNSNVVMAKSWTNFYNGIADDDL